MNLEDLHANEVDTTAVYDDQIMGSNSVKIVTTQEEEVIKPRTRSRINVVNENVENKFEKFRVV